MDINEGTTTEDLWTPFKELVAVVEGYLVHGGKGAPYAVHTFESVLRRHKQTFLSLFKNPAKNPASREEIKRGVTEGVTLPSIGRTLLSKELVDEAIIISDMYNVSELLALELLHTAQRLAARRPGLARGLLAVLLYYDGRRALVQALRELVMARDGVCWAINAREEIVSYVSRYVDQLISDGLLSNALDALRIFTLESELELLQNNRALPPGRHHASLVNSIETTRKLLAGVVFSASAQRGLNKDIILRIIAEQSTSPTLDATGALDEISLGLQMALLYALDLSVLHRREDGEELAKKLPLIQDPELIPALIEYLSGSGGGANGANGTNGGNVAGGGVRALCGLALGLALAALRRAPHSLLARAHCELLDHDELLVDAAIDAKVFEYLDEAILSTEFVAKEEYYQRRIHTLITDFIVLMHSKLMEMRVKADEAARAVQMYVSEGLTPPGGAGAGGNGARTRLDALLRCVERLYARDPLGLRHDYWQACQPHSHSQRAGGRAATLYKFVRLSGEVVCGALLAAYLRALASLCVPRHTWALLAKRDALSAHHLLTALARYHSNLRADPAPFSAQAHAAALGASVLAPAARPGKMLVRQEEVEALIAALKLIASVARQDQAACAAICENLQWDAVNVMFGLICCHIPLQLKAELMLTAAALGSWAATAGRVWAALDAAQLVALADKRGLAAELHEVECRLEQYPLSRAWLQLLAALSAAGPLPRALGAGARAPGLDPYVQHALQQLALPAPHRPYARPNEKWQMLYLCFRLFARWLAQYEPSPADFPPPGREPDTNPPPGFRLLIHLHTKSELLRLLLSTLDDAYDLLDRQALPGKMYVEQSLVLCLELLERALALERALLSAASDAGRGLLLVPLSKLILAPEGPDNRCRLVTVCKVLQHVNTLPAAAARAVALLCRALQAPTASRHLLASITHRPALAADIRFGFVECLEAEEVLEPTIVAEGEDPSAPSATSEASSENESFVRQAKEGVLVLLQHVLPTAPPNLAHFLLGYNLTDDPSRSTLSEAGSGGSPRSCLHALLDLLDQHVAARSLPHKEASNLIESCYRLIYWLCARPNTSAPILRFLRTRDYFLSRHIKATVDLKTASVATLSARSWLLRASACEAGAAGAGRQHAALSALLTALTHTAHHPTQEWEWCLLRRTLEDLPVIVEPAVEPHWELFQAQQLRQAIDSCDLPTGLGGKRISVSRVHALLTRELATLHATAPQRSLLAAEIQKVLDYVTEVNRQRNLAATLTHYYDSWRQLTEILFCVAPHDLLSLETKKNLLLNILQDLLNKIPPGDVLPQIGNLASGTVLLLLVNLRHCYILQKRESNQKSSEFEMSFFGPTNQIMQTNSLTLKFILHKILNWILISGGSTQKMRVNLYGALLNYLNIVNLKTSPADPEEEEASSTYVSRLDSSRSRAGREQTALKASVLEELAAWGARLLAALAGDAAAGAPVLRLAALAALHALLQLRPRDVLAALSDHGHLRSLVDSLLHDDDDLKESLEPVPKSLRVLYVYESKLALLVTLAGWRRGAESVLAAGALGALAALSALHAHPDLHAPARPHHAAHFLPSVASRFRQILVPALALCDALLTTLGPQNHSCVLQVTHAVLSHVECIDAVLRAAHPNSPNELLIEVEAITSVIGRAASREVLGGAAAEALGEPTALQTSAAAAQRVRWLMLALLARFYRPAQPLPDHSQNNLLYYKILCNVLTYARNILCDSSGRALPGPLEGGACGRLPAALQQLVRAHLHHDKLLATTAHQLHNLPTMTLDDMKKLLPSECENLSPVECRSRCREALLSRVRTRRGELAGASHALDATLHLVWARARCLLRDSLPADDNGHSLNSSAAWRSGAGDEALELRKELIAVFNDRFTEQLLDTAKNKPQVHRSFLEILVKDIKSLIQFSA